MNKYSLYLDVIQGCKHEGFIYLDVDRKKCYLDNNNYHIISKNGELLSKIDLNNFFKKEEVNGESKVKNFIIASLIPFILLTFAGGWLFLQIFVYGFLGLIRNQEKRYSCTQNQEYEALSSDNDKAIYLNECMSK